MPRFGKKDQPPALSPKQLRFIDEYLIDLDATKAARRAGYSGKTAKIIGCQNLTKLNLAQEIEARQQALSLKTNLTAERILAEIVKIGYANMADYIRISKEGEPYIDLSTMTRDQAAALSETQVEDYTEGRGKDQRKVRRVKIKFHDKGTALLYLAKYRNLFKEHESSKPKPVNIQFNVRLVRTRADVRQPHIIDSQDES